MSRANNPDLSPKPPKRLKKDGTPDPRYEEQPLEKRFFAKTKRAANGCLEWQGSKRRGYGFLRHGRKKVSAHRAAWFLAHGEYPPEDIEILHSCDNRACVGINHLSLGTHADNMADMRRKGRESRGERNPQAKLRVEEVALIKKRVEAGEVQRRLAEEFGVTAAAINLIARGKKWVNALARDLDAPAH